MAEQNQQDKNPMEPLQKGAEAAGKIQGAIKTGKAIAGIAKGAATGGPYGAVLMGLWANRKTVVIVAVSLIMLLILPILFVIMLPSVIFGGVDAEYDQPILNNDAQIFQNITDADQSVWMILWQRHDAVLAEISEQIANLGENERGVIVDVEMEQIGFNSTLILSQYSACKEYKEINIPDLARTVEAGADHLFSYTVTTSTSTNDDGETITTYHYTVTYAGDSYFADQIFKLDEKARELANNYAQNMSLQMYGSNFQGGSASVSAEVLQYAALIRQYAETYGISEYFDLICAVMMAESGGRGNDPMQASESPYNTRYPNKPNAIQEPEYSIECGVQALADCLSRAECTSPTDTGKISLALQGYNYGNGYIEWAVDKHGGYSEANAVEFSNMMKAKLGWSVYGNPRYVAAVLKYYIFPGKGGSDGWGSPFVGRDWRLAVTSEFGIRVDPLTGETGTFHTGIDIGYPIGTPINAVMDGVVEAAIKSGSGYGWHIVINHGNGIKTLYGHCSELLVSKGQPVVQGQAIALVGKTGRVTGPHLHLNVEINGQLQNPRNFIN